MPKPLQIAITAASTIALLATGCTFDGDTSMADCDYETSSLDYDEESDQGYSAQDVMETVTSSGATTVTWHLEDDEDDTDGGADDCNPGEIFNPIAEECDDNPDSDFEGELTWELSADTEDVQNIVADPDDPDAAFCDNRFEIGATLILETYGDELQESWDLTLYATAQDRITIGEEIPVSDLEGDLSLDADEDSDVLQLEGVINDEHFDGALHLDRRDATTDGAWERLLKWPEIDENDDGDGDN